MSDEDFAELEAVASPGAGACGGQFTANTMAMAFEVLGISPMAPTSSRPRTPPRRRSPSRPAGSWSTSSSAGCGPATSSPGARWRTRSPAWPARAARPTPCCTCWPSPARSGVELDIDDFDRVSERTPLLCDLKPGGRYVAVDLYKAGGVPVMLQRLQEAGLLQRGRDHRHRRDDRRARTRRHRDRGPAGRARRSTSRSSPPAAWPSCAATSLPRAAWSSSPATSGATTAGRRASSTARRRRWPR